MTDLTEFQKGAMHVTRVIVRYLGDRVHRGTADGAREAEVLLHHISQHLLAEFNDDQPAE